MSTGVLMAVNQQEYLDAVVGNPRYSALCRSFYACNTPLGADQGSGVMPGDLGQARRMLQEAGYAGEKVVIISPTDIPATHAMSQVTADLLRRLGMNVDFVATDWSALLARRANRLGPRLRELAAISLVRRAPTHACRRLFRRQSGVDCPA